jgi:hypothetical protein
MNVEAEPRPFRKGPPSPMGAAESPKDKAQNTSAMFNPLKRMEDVRKKGGASLWTFAVFVFIVMPIADILIAVKFGPDEHCSRPHMGILLQGTAVVVLLLVLTLSYAKMQDDWFQQVTALFTAGILLFMLVFLEWQGVEAVSGTMASHCNAIFWHAAEFTWVVVPVVVILFIILSVPCFFLCEVYRRFRMGAAVMQQNSVQDEDQAEGGNAFGFIPLSSSDSAETGAILETPVSQCGVERLTVWQAFCARRIEVTKLMDKYDKDQSGALDPSELEMLLKENAVGNLRVSELDLTFVLKVADLDGSGHISSDEVMYAIRTWYAWGALPRTVGRSFGRFHFGKGPMPPSDAWVGMLTDVNGGKPVTVDEAQRVRDLALLLGASEDRATVTQLRQAVAAWYLQIGDSNKAASKPSAAAAKKPSPEERGVIDHMKELYNLRANMEMALHGDIHPSAHTLAVVGTPIFVLFVLTPIGDIYVGTTYPQGEGCKAFWPGLNETLQWTGIVKTVLSLSGMCVLATLWPGFKEMQELAPLRLLGKGAFYTSSVLNLIMSIIGCCMVSFSTEMRCGTILWNYAHFVFVIAPVLTFIFGCCFFPCIMVEEFSQHTPPQSNV